MRYLYFLLFTVLITCFYSCSEKEQKKQANIKLQEANWGDTTAIGKVVDDYYKDSVFKTGKIAMEVRDAFMPKNKPYHYLQLQKILRPKFKQTSATVGYMPVYMKGVGDTVIVDFQIAWEQVSPTDSIGKFVVTDKFVQRVGSQPRYEWVKEEKYWIRKNVEVSKELKNNQIQNPSDKLKQMQESGAINKDIK